MPIQLRRDTAANWASANPTPADGQPCYATDSHLLKIGDGVTPYNSLSGISGSAVVADGDKGDITITGGVWSIDNDVITFAKMQNINTDKLLGRVTAGVGDVEEIAISDYIQSLLDDADAAAARTTLGLGTLATQNGTFSGTHSGSSSGTNTGDQTSIAGITGTMAQFNAAITDGDIQPLDSDLTTIAGLVATTDNFIQSKASAWASRTVAQVKTDLGLTGTNSGDQTTIVGITGTIAQFNAACTDADFQPADSDLTTIAGLTATTDSFLQAKASAWTTRTVAQVKTDLGLTGTNSGDQTSIVGITGTMAQFNTAITDGDIQPLDSDLTTIAGLTATTDSFLQAKASAWAARTIAQVKTDLGLTGTNSGDQTTIVGITGTLAQFNTAITDADIMPIAGGTFTGDIIVPAEVYGAGWTTSLEAPTKKDLYDKIQTLGAGGGGTILGTVGTTDNRIVRADGAGGFTAQGSLISVSDAGTMDLPDNQGYRINGVYVASYTTGDDVMNINQFGGATLALNASTGTKFISPNLYAELNATTFRFDAYTAARVPMRIKLAASQTANAFEIDSSAGSGGDILKITAAGDVVTSIIRSPGTSSLNRDLTLTTTMTGAQIGDVNIGPANSIGGVGNSGGSVYIDGGRGDTVSGPGGWVVISGGGGGTPNGNGGTLDLQPGARQGSGTAGKVRVKHPTSGFYGTLDMSLLTANRNFQFPDADTTLGAGGGGGLGGATGATDNAILRADGTGGATVQDSLVTIDDTGWISVPNGKGMTSSASGFYFNGVTPTISENSNSIASFNYYGGISMFTHNNISIAGLNVAIPSYSAAAIPLTIKLAASQTGNAFEIRKVDDTIMASIQNPAVLPVLNLRGQYDVDAVVLGDGGFSLKNTGYGGLFYITPSHGNATCRIYTNYPYFTMTSPIIGGGLLIMPQTTGYTIPDANEMQKGVFTNEGATARVDIVLPSAVARHMFHYVVQDVDGMRITAASGDTIRIGSTVTASGGYIQSTNIGNTVTLVAINATEWVAISSTGTWTDSGGASFLDGMSESMAAAYALALG